MSSRHLRKIQEEREKAAKEPPDESDEDYEPLYVNKAAPKFCYEGLQLSSDSEGELDPPSSESDVNEPVPEPVPSKKNNKKKKKQKKKSSAIDDGEEDEIEKTVKEVNALLGPAPEPKPQASAKQALVPEVLVVQQKHLNVANELKRKFGDDGEERRRVNRQAQLRIQKKSVIIPTIEQATFHKNGLSMSILHRNGGCVHFVFDHSEEYRRRHQRTMHAITRAARTPPVLDEAQRTFHVEAMIQNADLMFRFGESTPGNSLIEMSIAYMQYVAHPSFQLTDPGTRLSYQYMENRPFHIAVLKYLHLLTNRACHRTALELAKMLLNLDPSDPLAVLFIIDTVALRAREHQWLIDAVEHWDKERQAGYLFNMRFSKALAQFHVANTKGGGDSTVADAEIQDAIIRFPTLALKLLELAKKQKGDLIEACPLFVNAHTKISKKLKELIVLYAEFTRSKWREPEVIEWLYNNTKIVAQKYNSDPEVQEKATTLSNEQLNLFRSLPDEIVRHLCVIHNMSQLLVDGAVPQMSCVYAFDPAPPAGGVNRYRYSRTPGAPAAPSSALRDLFSSLLPNFAPPDLEYFMEVERNNPALEMAAAYAAMPLDDDLDEEEFELNLQGADGEPDLFAAVASLARTMARIAGPPDPRDPRDPRPDTPE